MAAPAIEVKGLWKEYMIGGRERRPDSFREMVSHALSFPFRRFLRRGAEGPPLRFWALRDVNASIEAGEVVGIIGRNGAGKSTLLKILSRISEPSRGEIKVRGRVSSLLEVGTGFHPELTGRENIYLNGAILGMSRNAIAKKFDEIVAFAEVDQFLDTPVKRYSSGMHVRLAFAVAAQLDPDVLVVDEVLAVGDAEFQKKCLGTMRQVGAGGRTVLFVSHNMPAVRALCTRAVVFDAGRLCFDGAVEAAIDLHLNSSDSRVLDSNWERPSLNPATGRLFFKRAAITVVGANPRKTLHCELELRSVDECASAFIAMDICAAGGAAIMQVLPSPRPFTAARKGKHMVQIEVELPPMIPGHYGIDLWVGSSHRDTMDHVRYVLGFEISDEPTLGRTFPSTAEHGYIVPKSNYEYFYTE